jgi:hypothetical protein
MGRPRLPLDEIEETPAVVDGDTRALTVLATDLSSRVVRMVGPQLDLTPTFRVRIESPRSVDAERPPLHGRGAEPDSPYCWSDWPFAATPTA